jgi:hypothetical protein
MAPLKTFKSGAAFAVEVVVWKGEKGCNFNINKRIHTDEQQADGSYYKDVKSIFKNELLAIKHLIDRALAFADDYDTQQYLASRGGAVAEPIVIPPHAQTLKGTAADDDDIPF